MTPAIVEEIWEYSTTKGATRLLLLAIAKYADPDGTNAYPSLATLEHLTQLSHSQVCLMLRQLVRDGHLLVTHGAGPKGGNLYTVLRPWDTTDRTKSSPKIGHAKIAHAKIARPTASPKIGPDLGPEEKEKVSVSISDVLKSDVLSSDCQTELQATVNEKAANWLRTFEHDLNPDYAQVLKGKTPDTGEGVGTVHTPAPMPTPASTPSRPPRKPRGEGLYTLGKLCKRGHDHEGTGQTLRRLPSGSCLQCDLERQEAQRQAQVQARRAATPARRIIDLSAHRQRHGG